MPWEPRTSLVSSRMTSFTTFVIELKIHFEVFFHLINAQLYYSFTSVTAVTIYKTIYDSNWINGANQCKDQSKPWWRQMQMEFLIHVVRFAVLCKRSLLPQESHYKIGHISSNNWSFYLIFSVKGSKIRHTCTFVNKILTSDLDQLTMFGLNLYTEPFWNIRTKCGASLPRGNEQV